MHGGHTDDYYYQLAANIRRYKGIHAPDEVTVMKTIDLRRGFDQWSDVQPEFEDHAFDTLPRNSLGNFQAGPYADVTGRNDFVSCKVARDAKNVYFYVKTQEPITSYKDRFWMLLFIDADENPGTGWDGYDFVVNAKVIDTHTTTVMRGDGTGHWVESKSIPMRVEGRELMIAIPRAVLGQKPDGVALDFHWADNIQRLGDSKEFLLHGDCAPDRRAKYRYTSADVP